MLIIAFRKGESVLNILPQLNANPTMNALYWVVLYLIAGVYFIEQFFHPFRDGECPGEETNERLIMFLCLVFWPIVVVSMSIGAIAIAAYRSLRLLKKFISKLFLS